jgi:DNA-binding MarR family transcriptional regulator
MTTKLAPGTTVLLTRLTKLVFRRSTEAALGMRFKHYMALAHLRDHDAVAQQALGEALCLDANNLVLLLNELEADGFALRRRDPADRRRHLVELTDEGRHALEHADAAVERIEDEVLTSLSPDDRATLRALLRRVLEPEGAPAP